MPPLENKSQSISKCTLVQRLQGGIGNQLFQISFALKLARASGSQLSFDESSYLLDTHNRKSILHKILPGADRIDISALHRDSTRLLREDDFPIPEAGLPKNYYLPRDISHLIIDGYWQDHRLVDSQEVHLFKKQLEAIYDSRFSSLAQRIHKSERATAVHFRRHDYSHHGICSTEYILQSLRWLAMRRGALDVFVFSDEPNFTRHLLTGARINHVTISSGDDLADLYLMSLCRHHIISNSTYSWWGAMLSGSMDVTYPDPWSLIHTSSPKLCPPHWRRVANALEKPVLSGDYYSALNQEQFRIDYETFLSQADVNLEGTVYQRPCLDDATITTTIDAHYVYHTAWAARRLLANPVAEHLDIGSDHRFTTIASAFQPMRFLDYRPCEVQLSNLETGHANLLDLAMQDGSVLSVSCMHVVEHIGLGRYGDPIDFHGASKAMSELERVLAPGGLLYFVVPVGEPCVMFNAHRIFRASDIVRHFVSLKLVEFSLVHDNGTFEEGVNISIADGQRYACGCFLFRKPL